MKLTKVEQETIVLYNEAESTAEVFTYDQKLLHKLERLAEKYPKQITRTGERQYLVPKSCVLIREPYSEERRKAASDRAKANGYRPPVNNKEAADGKGYIHNECMKPGAFMMRIWRIYTRNRMQSGQG